MTMTTTILNHEYRYTIRYTHTYTIQDINEHVGYLGDDILQYFVGLILIDKVVFILCFKSIK